MRVSEWAPEAPAYLVVPLVLPPDYGVTYEAVVHYVGNGAVGSN